VNYPSIRTDNPSKADSIRGLTAVMRTAGVFLVFAAAQKAKTKGLANARKRKGGSVSDHSNLFTFVQ
jgi:hypothetical protein